MIIDKAPVSIPMKPHIKKFVLYALDKREPIQVTERQFLGSAIMKALQEKRLHRFDRVLDLYTDSISVILNKEMRERSPKRAKLLFINVELDIHFASSLIFWVKAQMKMGSPANEACKNFLATLKIDETEYSYDAAYKVWQRYNERNRKLNNKQA